MRLFGYYALHTFKNQIRKLLKTWVLVFLLVCFGIGGIIGVGAAGISNLAERERGPVETIEETEDAEEALLTEEEIPPEAQKSGANQYHFRRETWHR